VSGLVFGTPEAQRILKGNRKLAAHDRLIGEFPAGVTRCPECNGRGESYCPHCDSFGDCHKCEGSGLSGADDAMTRYRAWQAEVRAAGLDAWDTKMDALDARDKVPT